jgi:hypothetical protein
MDIPNAKKGFYPVGNPTIADLEGKQRSRVDEKRTKIRRRRGASLFREIATDQKRASKIAIFTGWSAFAATETIAGGADFGCAIPTR